MRTLLASLALMLVFLAVAGLAFLYSGGTITSLGTLVGGTYSYAYDINDSGLVVGESSTSSGSRNAFLYSSGTMTNLGTLGGNTSTAESINNSGQIVGNSLNSGGLQDAFTYSSSTGMQDLNTLYSSLLVSGTGPQTGFTRLMKANGINSLGDIVGEGTYWNGTSNNLQAFLLEPASVPEPSSWAMFLVALGLLTFLRLRKRRTEV